MKYETKFTNNLKKDEIVLSINSTGINRKNNKIFLINLITDKNQIIQYFIDENSKYDLKEFINITSNKKLITFNGESFDLPFLKELLKNNSLDLICKDNFDIYLFLKKYNFNPLSSYSIKNVYTNLCNKDYNLGNIKDNIKLYKSYLENKDSDSLENLLYEGRLSVIYRYEILNSLMDNLVDDEIYFDIYDLNFKVAPFNFKISKNILNISLYNLQENTFELEFNSKYYSISSSKDLLNLKFKVLAGLIDAKTNATCVIYPDVFNIKNIYPNIKENLIPIFIDGKYNVDLIKNIIIDSLKNIKNYA